MKIKCAIFHHGDSTETGDTTSPVPQISYLVVHSTYKTGNYCMVKPQNIVGSCWNRNQNLKFN